MVNNNCNWPIDTWIELCLKYAKRYLEIYNDLERHNISYDTVIKAFRSNKELTLISDHGLGTKTMSRLLIFPLEELSVDYRSYYEKVVEHLTPIMELHKKKASQLNMSLTFDSFRVTDNNSVAVQMAKEVVKSPGKRSSNPIVLMGDFGSGKTHLVNALGNAVQETHPEMMVLYVSGDEFKRQYMDAVKSNKLTEYKDLYERVDVLILDNLQDIVGPGTQNCFFHVMDQMYQKDKQIVVTCNQELDDMKGMLDERLIEHLRWGRKIEIGKNNTTNRQK